MSLKDRYLLAFIGLHKAAWGQLVLSSICVLGCCCKWLDAYINTACQGVCINIKTILKSFLNIYFNFFFKLVYISLVTQQLEYRRATFHLVLGAKLIVAFSMPDLD